MQIISFADGLFSGSYIPQRRYSKSRTIFSSFSCISEDFYGWNRVFKEVDLINRISVPLTSELNGSPSERKYLWERGHWEKMRSGKGPSWLIIKSKWLSSICSWLLLRIGNNAHPVRSSWKRERVCVCGGRVGMYTKQPKLQISMLRSRGASKIRSGARRMWGVTGFLNISSN